MYRRVIIILIVLVGISVSGLSIRSEDLDQDKYINVEIKGKVERPGV